MFPDEYEILCKLCSRIQTQNSEIKDQVKTDETTLSETENLPKPIPLIDLNTLLSMGQENKSSDKE